MCLSAAGFCVCLSVYLKCLDSKVSQRGSDTCAYNVGQNGTCSACAAGKFKNAKGFEACQECTRGTYAPSPGSSVCLQCNPGEFSNVSADACSFCPRDSYSSADNSQCLSCPPFTTSDTMSYNLTQCSCNLGFTGPGGGPCAACVAGKFKPTNGSAQCTQCEPGKHVSTTGSTSAEACLICPRDSYSSADNSQCVACPANSFSLPGSSEAAHCQCVVGYTGNGSYCEACIAGTYKAVNGSALCSLSRSC